MEKSKRLIVKSNTLIEAKYKLTTREQKVILYLTSQINKNDEDFKIYSLPIKKFSKMMGMESEFPKYTEIREITRELQKKIIEIKIDENIYSVSWLSLVIYNKEHGSIDFRFDPFLKPYLLQLKEKFTSYYIENIILLKSSYAIRLYELLKQYEKIKERYFELNELKEILGIEDKYKVYGNFKLRILNAAKDEINEKTDLRIDFEEIKKGRKVEKIRFIIDKQSSKNANKQLGLFDEDIPAIDFSLYTQINDLTSKHGYSVNEKTAFRWAQLAKEKWEQDSENKLLYLIDEVNHNTDVKNPIGYITSLLKSKDDAANFRPENRLTKEDKLRKLMLGQDKESTNEKSGQMMTEEERQKRKEKMYSLLKS